MKMNSIDTIKQFLALPNEALPRAISDVPGDQCWLALRLMAGGNTAVGVCEADAIWISADRDGWRDGVSIPLT